MTLQMNDTVWISSEIFPADFQSKYETAKLSNQSEPLLFLLIFFFFLTNGSL